MYLRFGDLREDAPFRFQRIGDSSAVQAGFVGASRPFALAAELAGPVIRFLGIHFLSCIIYLDFGLESASLGCESCDRLHRA